MSQSESEFFSSGIGYGSFEESHLEPSSYGVQSTGSLPVEAWRVGEGSCPQQNIGESERMLSAAAGLSMIAVGWARGRLSGLALLGLGGGLLYRAYTGHCACYEALGISTAERKPATGVPAQRGCKIEKRLTIHRSPEELYQYWRHLENLPHVMHHLKKVEPTDEQHSHWLAEGVFGKQVEWDAEIINERENELIAWRSLPGGDIDTAGSIHFRPLRGDRATEVTLSMKYNPPAGKLGEQVAALFGVGLEAKLDEDLRRFKQTMESGATTSGNGLT